MKRLELSTFGHFMKQPDVTAVLFVAPCGQANMDQALNFAIAWAQTGNEAFGYVDVFDQVQLSRNCNIRALPTTLLFIEGEMVARLEGRHSASQILWMMKHAELGIGAASHDAGIAWMSKPKSHDRNELEIVP